MGTIIVVSGLPGTGKTTLSAELTRALGATYLRVDAVETALERAGIEPGPLGYAVVHELAQSNLLLGRDVVVDLVNPWPLTRSMWADLAAATGARYAVFECFVADEVEHRRRVEARQPDLEGQTVPTWQDVIERDYYPWDEERDGPRVRIDMTDGHGVEDALRAIEESK